MTKNQKAKSAEALPQAMFYKNPVPIGQERHAKAGLSPITHCKFAMDTNSIALNASEFVEAAKCYPIVFTVEEPTPVALVGLENQNYFIDADGYWLANTYIPAYIRRYPFIFMHLPDQEQLLLCVDEGCEQYSDNAGKDSTPLYDKDGKASELTNSALEFAKTFHQHQAMTRNFIDALADNDLLMVNTSTVTLAGGRQVSLNGFQMIDEQKFMQLPDKKILEFRKKGWLPFIYFALMSASNWQRLGDMASQRETIHAAS